MAERLGRGESGEKVTFRIRARGGRRPQGGGTTTSSTQGEERSKPNDALVSDFHKEWFGDYHSLESENDFIQWLLPLFLNSGVNWEAHKLGRGEAREIRRDLTAAVNVVKSYRLMLDFYGFRLEDDVTGKVVPLENREARKARFENFNYSSHNYLRISTTI